MRTCIFDLETSSLYANSGIILCAVLKEYRENKVTVIRADKFKSWDKQKSDNSGVVHAIAKEMEKFDIYVAHNGQFFDKAWLNTAFIKYGLRPSLRFEKFFDPLQAARRHMRLAKNSLASLIDYFDIQDTKTPISFKHWIQASHDSNRKSMDYIVTHCIKDVKALEGVYDITRKLSRGLDDTGSGR